MKSRDITPGEHYLVSDYREWTNGASFRRMVALSSKPFRIRHHAGYYVPEDHRGARLLTDLVPATDLPEERHSALMVGKGVAAADSWKAAPNWTVGALMVTVEHADREDGDSPLVMKGRAAVIPLAQVKATYEEGTAIIRQRQRERTRARREHAAEVARRATVLEDSAAALGLRPATDWTDNAVGTVRQPQGGVVSMSLETFAALAQRVGGAQVALAERDLETFAALAQRVGAAQAALAEPAADPS